jgi:hypothetical protein
MKKMVKTLLSMGILFMGTLPTFAQNTAVPSLPVPPSGVKVPVPRTSGTQTDISMNVFLDQVLPNFINWTIGAMAVIAVFYIMWAGYQFFLAQGDEDKVKKAVETIMWAVNGLIIALMAYIIIQIVVNVQLGV